MVVKLPSCMHVHKVGALFYEKDSCPLANEETSIVRQVHAVSYVKDLIHEEASDDPFASR